MRTLRELGAEVAIRRRALGLKQLDVAKRSGVTAESLSRFERGRTSEFGSRKLMAVLAAVGMELALVEISSDQCQPPRETTRTHGRPTSAGLEA
ncbi:helix-turn-helix domain-containing protein [Pseudomonas sp. MWU13-2860]|uniref:helix-turn-helix domain-containing protein n=1 Tax=Pseudomonas batumici TaxID=226910 RepID=UPI000CD554F8|nr:helix-turn-helix domain-containing protein [Pseudomonas sp. MWU13-2860]